MKTSRVLCLSVAAALIGASPSSQAWDGCGHKTVAVIAYDQLTPATKKKVDAVFKNDKRHRQFVSAATWPDDIKQGNNNDLPVKAHLDKPWHFVDIPYDAAPAQADTEIANHNATVDPAHENSANVVTAISFFTTQLKSNNGDATAKADSLSWLIHLVGDVHQPLHCVTVTGTLTNYTPPAKGDAGGNGFNIHHPARELHALWDDTFDEPTGGRHEEGRDDSDAHAKEVAQSLAGVSVSPADLAKTNPADWAKESFAQHEFVYTPPVDPNSHAASPAHDVTPEYLNGARARAETRVVLAGHRLAKLLETIYGSSH